MELRLPTGLPMRTEPQSPKRARVERDVLQAVDTLLQEGERWTDLSIERIATAAGISRTAFYFYFRDKRELLIRLTEDVSIDLFAAATWLTDDSDGADMIPAAVAGVHELYRSHGALLQAIVEVSAVDEIVGDFFRTVIDQFIAAAAGRIEAEQAAGRADPIVPAASTAFALVWMTERAFYAWRVGGVDVVPDDHLRALADIWTRAVYGV